MSARTPTDDAATSLTTHEELIASERRFRTMAETMHQLVLTLDAEGEVDYCNRRWLQQVGVTLDDLRDQSWMSIVHPHDRTATAAAWAHAVKTGEILELELRLPALDKKYRWFLCSALPEFDASGRTRSWVFTFTDIHDTKIQTRNDRLLARSAELLGLSLEYKMHLPEILQLLIPQFADLAAVYVFGNDSAELVATTGGDMKLEEFPIAHFQKTGLSEIHKLEGTSDMHPIRTGFLRPLKARGHTIGCMIVGYAHDRMPEKDDLEAIDHLCTQLASVIDTSTLFEALQHELRERKKAESEVREREHHLRVTTEAMPQIVWGANAKGEIDYLNHRWYELTGHKLQDLAGDWNEYLHEDDCDRAAKAWFASVRTGEIYEFEFRLKRWIDQAYLWHLARAVPIREANGSVSRWIGTITNIDDKRRSEEQTAFLAEASRILLDCLDQGSIIQRVRDFIVPRYADWISLDLVDDSGESSRVLSFHHIAEKEALLRRVYDEFPSPKNALYGYPRVLKTGRSQLFTPTAPGVLESTARSEEHRNILIASDMRSTMCVPLITRGRVIGCLTAAVTEKRRVFDQRDLLLIEDLALRIATTLDNAHLLAEAQRQLQMRREAESRAQAGWRQDELTKWISESTSEQRV